MNNARKHSLMQIGARTHVHYCVKLRSTFKKKFKKFRASSTYLLTNYSSGFKNVRALGRYN